MRSIVPTIRKLLTLYRFESILVVGWCFLWLRGIGTHYLWHDIPLGYDPWLYKVLFEEMNALSFRRRSELSWWLQNMYPPFLWMLWSLLMKFGWSSEWLVTRWAVWLSWLIVISLTALSRRFGSVRMSAIVFFLACSSFVLYQLFWWNYLKQLLGVVVVLSSVHLVLIGMKHSYTRPILVWVLLSVWWLTQRPALILCGILGVVWLLSWVWKRSHWAWAVVALWVLSSVGWYFRDIQIASMIQPFFDAIDIPVYTDGYKAWGTFLTMSERLRTDWIVILWWVLWLILLSMKKSMRKDCWIFIFIYITLIVRVGWQASFYQRMIWYLSPFLIVWTWCLLMRLTKQSYWKFLVICICMIQWISTIYWIDASWSPLIVQQELEMIQQIPQLVEEDAIIMLSWIRYSPRVRWRSEREVIAPGLFDYTPRWRQWDGWADKWIDVSWDEKCSNAFETFSYLGRPLYARVWLTQDEEIMDGWCMKKILSHSELPTALYRLTDERN
jgi:hypothetical protein